MTIHCIPSSVLWLWHHLLILSLSGQYILKNIVLVGSAFTIYKDCQTNGWRPLRPFASFFCLVRHSTNNV